jgi:hypothetical protein
VLIHDNMTMLWTKIGQFRRFYPKVRVEEDVLVVRDGPFLTAAGVSSGSARRCTHTATGLSALAAPVWLGVLIAYLVHLLAVDRKVLAQDLLKPVTDYSET